MKRIPPPPPAYQIGGLNSVNENDNQLLSFPWQNVISPGALSIEYVVENMSIVDPVLPPDSNEYVADVDSTAVPPAPDSAERFSYRGHFERPQTFEAHGNDSGNPDAVLNDDEVPDGSHGMIRDARVYSGGYEYDEAEEYENLISDAYDVGLLYDGFVTANHVLPMIQEGDVAVVVHPVNALLNHLEYQEDQNPFYNQNKKGAAENALPPGSYSFQTNFVYTSVCAYQYETVDGYYIGRIDTTRFSNTPTLTSYDENGFKFSVDPIGAAVPAEQLSLFGSGAIAFPGPIDAETFEYWNQDNFMHFRAQLIQP